MRLSLTAKVLLFVIVPLVAQMILLAFLASLENSAERALEASVRHRRIADGINDITNEIFELHKLYRSAADMEKLSMDNEICKRHFEKLRSDFVSLKKLARAQPEVLDAVLKSEKAVNDTITAFRSIQLDLMAMHPPIGSADRFNLVRKFRRTARQDAVFQNLIQVGMEQRRLSEEAPEEQAIFRQHAYSVMLGMGVLNLCIGIMLSLFLTRGITTRLKKVNENTFKLASGLPLNEMIEGSDEIAQLDQVFHKMAVEMKEAARKQSAMIDNARDFICTLDDQGRFIAANPASQELFQIPPEDLLGKHFIDLVADNDATRALTFLEELKAGNNPDPLDLEMKTGTGETIETLWSAHWSQEEGSLFCVIHDTTERRRAEKLKQEVMAMITHDLRTPLSVVSNVLTMLEDGVHGDLAEKGRRYVMMARRNSERMISLVNDLLDVDKIKSGMVTLDIGTVELDESFGECEAICAGYAEEQKVELLFKPSGITIQADSKRLDRVLANLVSNAVKFSPEGKTVTVSAEMKADSVHIKVEDEGPGIPEDMRESVFERFQQVSGAATDGKGGSGLGLAICKGIVELHGGKVWVEGKSTGSVFVFSLPVSSSAS
ncbi:MAG: ATP-binding protein [Candidatus Obscuribacterales bacterium]